MELMKKEYPKHDVAISNLLSSVLIDVINPDLMKEFYSLHNVVNYHKMSDIVSNFARIGKGLVFNE